MPCGGCSVYGCPLLWHSMAVEEPLDSVEGVDLSVWEVKPGCLPTTSDGFPNSADVWTNQSQTGKTAHLVAAAAAA